MIEVLSALIIVCGNVSTKYDNPKNEAMLCITRVAICVDKNAKIKVADIALLCAFSVEK